MKELVPFPMKRSSQGGAALALAGLDATMMADLPGGPAAVDPAWAATLEVVSGTARPMTVRLGSGPVQIGRTTASDVVIVGDDLVSRSHAEIRYEEDGYVIEDLGSSNGVRLDEKRVKNAPLTSGARIGLGRSILLFQRPVPEVTEPERKALVERSDILATLSPKTKAAVVAGLVARFVPKGGVLLRQNAPMDRMVFVHRGCVRVTEINDEGGERVSGRVEAGDCFGERALVSETAMPSTLIADSDSCILELSKAAFENLMAKDPEQSLALASSVRERLKAAQTKGAETGTRRDDLDNLVTSTDVTIIGEDRRITKAKERVEGFAKNDKETQAILIAGPQGTGKRTFARHFHRSGSRATQPYVEISVPQLANGGAAAAIFGVEPSPGAAAPGKTGFLEMIGEGTLAIAHAEMLDAHVQALLVSYLEQGWFHRVHGQQTVKARVQLVFLATGEEADVLALLQPSLRERLVKTTVVLPALTLRSKDIPLLAEHYLAVQAARLGRKTPALSREATHRLVSYRWPGNITELENVMQRAVIVGSEDTVIDGDLLFVAPPEKEIHKLNLLRNESVRTFLRHPRLVQTFVWIDIVFVAIVTFFTIYGGTRPPGHPLNEFATNPGMLVTWLIWFPLLPVSAFLIGRVWCGICPIAGIGDLAGKIKRYDLPAPNILKRLDFWLLAATFILVDYVEELFGVADRPIATGVFLVILVYFAVAMTVLWERKTFCRYVCPLSGVLGAYSSMSMFEIRGNKKVCQTQCGEYTCFKGTAEVPGCPLSAHPASINSNAECMMCGNCLKSCDRRGVQLNLRPPLQELWRNGQPMLAMSVFGVVLVGLMAKHQFPKLTLWAQTQQSLGWTDGSAHSILFLAFAAFALVSFLFSSTLSAASSREPIARNMATYGVAYIPLAFSGHLAHLVHEFLGGGLYELLGYLSKVYASLVNGVLIASNTTVVSPFVNPAVLTFIKFLIVLGGFAGSLIALVMIARRVEKQSVFARTLPHMMLLVLLWAGYVAIFTGSTGEATPVAQATAAAVR